MGMNGKWMYLFKDYWWNDDNDDIIDFNRWYEGMRLTEENKRIE